jgi:hypothetical protein
METYPVISINRGCQLENEMNEHEAFLLTPVYELTLVLKHDIMIPIKSGNTEGRIDMFLHQQLLTNEIYKLVQEWGWIDVLEATARAAERCRDESDPEDTVGKKTYEKLARDINYISGEFIL